ncbi:putative secreted protein [Granulibacter bethesdensis]|uniref:Secreted protein n=1 Tax=Granulibacter bethesdensis TaxID=364410 RepID=A0AAC9K8H0_9PROT|nr:hypothetical protein [Granulibacter bethesdensis]APH55240.1 putative secreted protein [Granulibacter bethesdensis]APH62827.1 putative secreted protein [Granulibacter bethesdensis]
MLRYSLSALFSAMLLTAPAFAADQPGTEPSTNPAVHAVFESPHLANITQPETLIYSYEYKGPQSFTDTVSEQIIKIHPDGTKLVGFHFLTGDRFMFTPSLDDYRGNPLVMIFLEHDVMEMKKSIGMAAAYFRARVKEGFFKAAVTDTTFTHDGKSLPARQVVMEPFATESRLQNVPFIQHKKYTIILCDQLPGGIAQIRTEQPGDPKGGIPPISQILTFKTVKP